MMRVEIKSGDERIKGVEVGHPMADVLSKLDTLLNVDLDFCSRENVPII